MNKKQLIEQIAQKCNVSKSAAEIFVTAYENTIKETLSIGERVELFNFMKLEVKDVAGREGRNPQTGAAITIAPYKKVAVKVLKGLKDCAGN